MSTVLSAATIDLIGGRVCLDFANTLDWYDSPRPVDALGSYTDLLAWSEHAGVLEHGAVGALTRLATAREGDARVTMQRARDLRWAIYRIFAAVAAGREIEPLPLARLNAELGAALSHATLVPAGNGLVWDWAGSETALDAPLWSVARSAAELLTTPELGRVRECAGPSCSWLFVDASRNGSRRFCSPTSCGNRDRVRRFYARRRRNVTAPRDGLGDEGFPSAETSG